MAGVSSLEEANRFLRNVFIPFWNGRFTVTPVEAADAHRPLPSRVDLNALFAERETRVLREDFTFRYRNEHWQVETTDAKELRPRQKVTIERRLDGSLHYHCGGRYLTPVRFVAPPPPPTLQPAQPSQRHRPSPDHPWRKPVIAVTKPHARNQS